MRKKELQAFELAELPPEEIEKKLEKVETAKQREIELAKELEIK